MPTAAVVGVAKATVPALSRLVTVELPVLFQVVPLASSTEEVPAASDITPFNSAPLVATSELVPATELNTLVVPVTVPPLTLIVLLPALARKASPLAFTVALFRLAVPLFSVCTATLLAPFRSRLPE